MRGTSFSAWRARAHADRARPGCGGSAQFNAPATDVVAGDHQTLVQTQAVVRHPRPQRQASNGRQVKRENLDIPCLAQAQQVRSAPVQPNVVARQFRSISPALPRAHRASAEVASLKPRRHGLANNAASSAGLPRSATAAGPPRESSAAGDAGSLPSPDEGQRRGARKCSIRPLPQVP